MKNCKNCSYQNDDEFIYCQECGERLDGKKICFDCKKEVPGEAKFCGYCGYSLKKDHKSYLNLFTKIAYLVVILLCMIAVFFPILEETDISSIGDYTIEKIDIFRLISSSFLNDGYKEIRKFFVITTVVIACLSVLTTLALGIISIIKIISSLVNNKKEIKHDLYLLPIFSYLVFFFIISSLFDPGYMHQDYYVCPFALGVIVIAVVIIVIAKILGLIVDSKEISKRKWIITSFKLASFVFLLTGLFLFNSRIVVRPIRDNNDYYNYLESIINFIRPESDRDLQFVFLALSIIGMAYLCITSIVLSQKKQGLIKFIVDNVIYGVIITLFILSIIGFNEKQEIKMLGTFISLIVLSVLSFGLNISSFVIEKTEKK